MTTRRGFLWLCGASTAGIYLAGSRLFELPKRMVLQLSGSCSFCGKERQKVFGLAGVVGKRVRICDECLALCRDILSDDGYADILVPAAGTATHPPARADDDLDSLLHEAAASHEPEVLVEEIRRRLEQHDADRAPPRDFHCAFCDRSRRDVRNLITGPRLFICDDCTWDATGLLGMNGLRLT